MIVLIIGPQGSGKTSHAQAIAARYGLHHIDIGELIRQQSHGQSPKAELIDRVANQKGQLLPDGLVFELLSRELTKYHFTDLIIDGYPRTANQYQLLKEYLHTQNRHIDRIIYLTLSDEVAVQRVQARSRQDDQPQAIAARLEDYHKITEPALEVIKADNLLSQISADGEFSHVCDQISQILDPIKPPTSAISLEIEDPKIGFVPQPPSDTHPLLYVLTHTESVYNRDDIFTGHLDVGLSEKGFAKAKLAAEILKNKRIDVAYRSRMLRNQQTLDAILAYHPNIPVVIDDRFIERDYGQLSGQSKTKFAQEHPDLWPIYHRSYDIPPPNGESIQQVEARVLPALRDVLIRIKAEKIHVLIVAHSNSIRPIRRFFEKLTTDQMMALEHLRHQIFTYVIDDSVPLPPPSPDQNP